MPRRTHLVEPPDDGAVRSLGDEIGRFLGLGRDAKHGLDELIEGLQIASTCPIEGEFKTGVLQT